MSEDFEGHTNDPQEAIQMFAEQVIEASGYVLEGAFRSVTIEGDLIALFMNRDPENLGKVIHAALNMAAEDATQAGKLTVTFDFDGDALTMTSLPLTVLGDHTLN